MPGCFTVSSIVCEHQGTDPQMRPSGDPRCVVLSACSSRGAGSVSPGPRVPRSRHRERLASGGMVPAFVTMLKEDRRRRGFTVGQVAYRIGVSRGQ